MHALQMESGAGLALRAATVGFEELDGREMRAVNGGELVSSAIVLAMLIGGTFVTAALAAALIYAYMCR